MAEVTGTMWGSGDARICGGEGEWPSLALEVNSARESHLTRLGLEEGEVEGPGVGVDVGKLVGWSDGLWLGV